LGYGSLWYDEAVSAFLAQKSLPALTAHTAGDIHPPLYYYLLHFWIRLAGDSEFALAFLSLLFGLVLVPLAFYVGQRWYDRRVGLLAAGLVALSPFNLWYSQEVRMYTLGALLGLLSLIFLLRLMEAPAGKGNWLGYIIVSALGLYSLYYFAFLLLAFNLVALIWWLCKRKGRTLLRWFLAQGAVLLLYLPWLPIAFRQASQPPVPPWRSFTGLGQVVLESWTALSFGQSIGPGVVWPALFLTLALFLLGLSQKPKVGAILAAHLLLPVLVIYLISLFQPLYHVRYVFTYSPPFYILLAAGLARLKGRALPLSLVVILSASAYSVYNFHFDPHYATDDHRGAVEFLEERLRPGDALLINAGYAYPAFLYYYDGPIAWRGRLVDYRPETVKGEGVVILQSGSIGGSPTLGWGDPDSDFYPTTEEETARALERLFAHHPRLWVYRIYDTVTDPQGFIRGWLSEHGGPFEDQLFAGDSYMRVQGYLTPLSFQIPQGAKPLGVDLGETLRLEAYQVQADLPRAGELLFVTLYWSTLKRPPLDYHVALYLVDGEGTVLTQRDEMPLGSSYLTSRWPKGIILRHPMALWLPKGAVGEYTLQVGVYNLSSGEFLKVRDEGRGVGGARVLLDRVTIR
jgi:hypothetical protein